MRTYEELIKEALDIQNASNLSGVVHTFSRAITDLREILSKEGKFSTEAMNGHPVSILYSSKIASLTMSEDKFHYAYSWSLDMIEGIRKE